MARSVAIILLAIAATIAFPGTVDPHPELAHLHPAQPSDSGDKSESTPLTAEQQNLTAHAIGRFNAQGLELPAIEFVFHDDLEPCHGHKGLFHASTATLEMCSMDRITMLHELAHAWANENLSERVKDDFVISHDLDSWNNHDDEWARRGTEHVAETIAWALAEDPHHVRWVETLSDGSKLTTHRILTLDVDVDTLLDNFRDITSIDPVFRHPDEWAVDEGASTSLSPELARLGG
jgi:hypothetical protein